jgi:hypothetical protein
VPYVLTAWFTIDTQHIAGLVLVPMLGLVIKTIKTVPALKNLSTAHAVATVAPPVCHFFTKFKIGIYLLTLHLGEHRWAGCRCDKDPKKRGTQTCTTESCKCRKMGWECDPMVCECDNATYVHRRAWRGTGAARQWSKRPREMRADGKHYCQNSDIQRGLAAVREFKVTTESLADI